MGESILTSTSARGSKGFQVSGVGLDIIWGSNVTFYKRISFEVSSRSVWYIF